MISFLCYSTSKHTLVNYTMHVVFFHTPVLPTFDRMLDIGKIILSGHACITILLSDIFVEVDVGCLGQVKEMTESSLMSSVGETTETGIVHLTVSWATSQYYLTM